MVPSVAMFLRRRLATFAIALPIAGAHAQRSGVSPPITRHYDAQRDFEMYPAEQRYERVGDTSYATVAAPLDDASFLYFVRTLSLRVGEEYRFDRYFQLAGNPIILRVLRTERITVPAGTFDAIVVQPLITTRGIFSQKGRAQVWLRADGSHEVLQMNSHLVFGSLTLVLTGETKAVQPVIRPHE